MSNNIADLFNESFEKNMGVTFKKYHNYNKLDINKLDDINKIIYMINFNNKKFIFKNSLFQIVNKEEGTANTANTTKS